MGKLEDYLYDENPLMRERNQKEFWSNIEKSINQMVIDMRTPGTEHYNHFNALVQSCQGYNNSIGPAQKGFLTSAIYYPGMDEFHGYSTPKKKPITPLEEPGMWLVAKGQQFHTHHIVEIKMVMNSQFLSLVEDNGNEVALTSGSSEDIKELYVDVWNAIQEQRKSFCIEDWWQWKKENSK